MHQYHPYMINNFVQCGIIDNKIDRVWEPLEPLYLKFILDKSRCKTHSAWSGHIVLPALKKFKKKKKFFHLVLSKTYITGFSTDLMKVFNWYILTLWQSPSGTIWLMHTGAPSGLLLPPWILMPRPVVLAMVISCMLGNL